MAKSLVSCFFDSRCTGRWENTSHAEWERPIVTDVASSVSLFVCLYVCYAQITPPGQTRQNSPVCAVCASAVWIGYSTTQDCRRQKIWIVNTLIAIVQFTPPRQTRQDYFVVSCVAVWIESAQPLGTCLQCRVCVGMRQAVVAVSVPRRM